MKRLERIKLEERKIFLRFFCDFKQKRNALQKGKRRTRDAISRDVLVAKLGINSQFKNKRVFIAFPPKRNSVALKNQSKGSMVLGRKTLKDSQLEEKLINKFGYEISKPKEWNNDDKSM